MLVFYNAGYLCFQQCRWWLDSEMQVPLHQVISDVQVGNLKRKWKGK